MFSQSNEFNRHSASTQTYLVTTSLMRYLGNIDTFENIFIRSEFAIFDMTDNLTIHIRCVYAE